MSGASLTVGYSCVAWQCVTRNLYTITYSLIELANIVFHAAVLLLISPNFYVFLPHSLVQSFSTFAFINRYQTLYSTRINSFSLADAAPTAVSVSLFPATPMCSFTQQNFTDLLFSAHEIPP